MVKEELRLFGFHVGHEYVVGFSTGERVPVFGLGESEIALPAWERGKGFNDFGKDSSASHVPSNFGKNDSEIDASRRIRIDRLLR